MVPGQHQGEGFPPGCRSHHSPGVPMDQGGHNAPQQPPDGRRGSQKERRRLGDGDNEEMGQSPLCQDSRQLRCRLLHRCLLDKENSVITKFLFPKENFSKPVF